MIFRAGRLIAGLVATLTITGSCSSATAPLGSRAPASAPPDSPTSTAPDRSLATPPAPASPAAPTALPSACVAPADAALQDQDPDDHQVPWRRNSAPRVVINFETQNLGADWIAELQKGVTAWNRSACLDTRLVQTCQVGTNCVTVTVEDTEDDGNFDAVESGGFTIGGHIGLLETLTGGERTNVTIHEMGHAVGLAHRRTEGVLMNGDTYDNVFDPDDVDFQNLSVLYGRQV